MLKNKSVLKCKTLGSLSILLLSIPCAQFLYSEAISSADTNHNSSKKDNSSSIIYHSCSIGKDDSQEFSQDLEELKKLLFSKDAASNAKILEKADAMEQKYVKKTPEKQV